VHLQLLTCAQRVKGVAGVADEALQNERLVAEALDGAYEAVFEPAESWKAGIAEFDVLEMAPNQLHRVQFRRVGGEAF
jgi:hypothetical protein